MKYIFDFDDVLFNNAKFKEHMFEIITKTGISEEEAWAYYNEVREKEFSLKTFIAVLLDRKNIIGINPKDIYDKIVTESDSFINKELIEIVKKIRKENCFIVTNGDKEFQQDKIDKSGIFSLFFKIYIISESKKEIVYNVCNEYKNEEVIFIEDKEKFIKDIDPTKCPNLKTILYTGQDLKSLFPL